MHARFDQRLTEAADLLDRFRSDAGALDAMAQARDALVRCFQKGNKVLACGNGGSMCDAMHFAEELSGRFRRDRRPYGALALSDPAHMSCVANDYGFEHVFSRQVEALGKPGDVLLVLSTSGSSPNIVAAAQAARARGVLVVGFLGGSGGDAKSSCDIALVVPSQVSERIQELHMMALHLIIEEVEIELGHGP